LQQPRGKGSSAIIVYVRGFSGNDYVEDPSRILTRFEWCPLTDTPHRLTLYGGYRRYFVVFGLQVLSWVYRRACRECQVTFSLLPECALAYHQHPLATIAARVWAALKGTSCRNREFLLAYASGVPVPEEHGSWSDLLASVQTWPCCQLLARWSRSFAAEAEQRIHLLAAACILLKVDLQSVAQNVAGLGTRVPEKLNALSHALGLVHASRGLSPLAPVALEDFVPELLRYLNGRLLPEKHKVLQASGGRFRYDYLVI